MNHSRQPASLLSLSLVAVAALGAACTGRPEAPRLDRTGLAVKHFQKDTGWYLHNIPFFECSDKQIEAVYYYRWKLYKAHLRSTGDNQFVITEFINHVPWDREPFCTINAASMHHIMEGRWLRDPRYMNSYVRYLYAGGNDRRYSESVADATYAYYQLTGDSAFVVEQLDAMKRVYDGWVDHYDSARQLYYIPAMPDATEYTIASIDASGGTGGFEGGEAYRPTINSYQYANALAISRIAALKGDENTRKEFERRAELLKTTVETQLWNPALTHFTDRFQVGNQYVKSWAFIRGRELAGFVPWYFNLPSDTSVFTEAWKHMIDTTQLLGSYGYRTNEPSYQYYFKQYTFHEGKRGSQWNGPSWPYQTSQVLTAMANVLNNYHQDVITKEDYLHALRLFTQQHYLANGKINLVENYDPNLGGPIVHFYWSNHYLHSSYNNLVISGICGVRPSEGETLTLNPLVNESIAYFFLDNIRYHGHDVSVLYDRDGTYYNRGKGIKVFVDGEERPFVIKNGKYEVNIGKAVEVPVYARPGNEALNIAKKDFPVVTASVNNVPDSVYQVVDGRSWYFPEVMNGWGTMGSTGKIDWVELDFGTLTDLTTVKFYPIDDGKTFAVPGEVNLEYWDGEEWQLVEVEEQYPKPFLPNRLNSMTFDRITTQRLRVIFLHPNKQVFISELECYGK
jgi:hypothetical protein